MDFQTLHAQHRAILKLASAVVGAAEKVQTREDAGRVREALDRLNRVLAIHLEAEDRAVMPALMRSRDPEVRATARDCHEEMGGIASVWADFLEKWDADRIHAEREGFASTTGRLMGALAHRVEREERELYPLAQRAVKHAA